MLNKYINIRNPYKEYLENNTIIMNKPLGLNIYW